MNEMIVTCDKCNNSVKLECIEKECKYLQDNQNRNLIDVIGQPLACKPTKMEKRVAVYLVSRMLHQGDDTVVSMSTGGIVRL